MRAGVAVADLVEISRYAAQHPRFIQGGGGNCSVKFSGKMAITASGRFLEEVGPQEAFVILDFKSQRPITKTCFKASVETPLHTLLGTYVIHTHPIAVGALICSKQGKKHFREIFPEAVFDWMDYVHPGEELRRKVKVSMMGKVREKEKVLFLQNHGLFVSAMTKDRCMKLHEETVRRCEVFFGRLAEFPKLLPHLRRHLTPDHAIYTHYGDKNLSPKQIRCQQELKIFLRDVAGLLDTKGWNYHYLPQKAVGRLLGKRGERYRENE